MDSLDFRFGAGRKGITVEQHNPLPSSAGHSAVSFEFQHDDGWLPDSTSIARSPQR